MRLSVQRAEAQRGDEPVVLAVPPVKHRSEVANLPQRVVMEAELEERPEVSLPPSIIRLAESPVQIC